jgi:FtsP/CotA-like multicopper oxidase with cupredoxin domain
MGGPFYWGVEPDKNHPNYLKTLNLKTPLRKDMISIWRHQWAVIRLRPENPGMWLLHCHMEQHVPSGMLVALNVKPSLQPPIPFDTPTSGNCPVHGWPHTAVEEPKEVTTELDVWDWIVNYKRATIAGESWNTHRLNPNQIEPEDRASVLLANGESPGTTIEAVEGDTITIRVKNNGYADALAIHFHGQEMRGTPWMDGTYGVSQAGVFPDTDFVYSFTAGPVGTHAYYGLVDPIQKARGLKGALIVRPKTDTRADLYDEEIVMQIADTWREPEVCLMYNYMDNEKVPHNCPPVDKVTFDGQWGDGGKYTPLPVYEVKAGKCYRLRVLAQMTQVQRLQFSIEGHSLSLLAVDGTDVTPLEVSSVSLHAGERYDFQLCANQGGLFRNGDFTILAEAPELCEAEYLERTGHKAPETCSFQATLQYKGLFAGGQEPIKKHLLPHLDLGTWDSHLIVQPLEAPPVLKTKADASFNLTLGEMADGKMFLHTSEVPWRLPSTPLLMTKGLECTESAPIINIPETASDVELIVNNAMLDAHVIHLHGTRFQVMSSSIGMDESSFASSAPLLRDTVLVPSKGQVSLRVVADNAGMWMLRSMNANAHLRGAATVLNILPSQQAAVPSDIPTGGPCAPAPALVI